MNNDLIGNEYRDRGRLSSIRALRQKCDRDKAAIRFALLQSSIKMTKIFFFNLKGKLRFHVFGKRGYTNSMNRILHAVVLFFVTVPALLGDNIYLKSNYVLVNVQCRMIVGRDLIADGTDRQHKIQLDFIAMIDTLPIDLTTATRMVDQSIFEWSSVTRAQVLAAGQPVTGQISISTTDGRMIFGHYAGTRDTAITIATTNGIVVLSPDQILTADRITLAGCDSASIEGTCPARALSQYHQQRLQLELRGSTGYLFESSYPFATPTIYDHWSQWNVSCANEPLSEEEFFRSAGLNKEAVAAKSFHKTSQILRTVGAIAVACGALLFFADHERTSSQQRSGEITDNTSSLSPMAIGATMLAIGGSATLVIGFVREGNMYPYSKARTVADEYNQKLILNIQKTL
jgi:hypothetical protein